MSAIEDPKRTLAEEVRRLSEIRSTTLMLSLYVPPGEEQQAVSFLRGELAQSRNIKDRQTRKNVETSLTQVIHLLQTVHLRAVGTAVFAGHGAEPIMVDPPEPILGFVYRCERLFYLEPLRDILEAKQIVGLVVMDRQEASFGWTDGRRIVLVKNIGSYIPGKHHMGGMSQARYARIIEHMVEEFFTKVGEKAGAVFLPMLDRLSAIYVGGPGSTKDEWLKWRRLDYRLKAKLHPKTFSTGYTDEQGLKEIAAYVKL